MTENYQSASPKSEGVADSKNSFSHQTAQEYIQTRYGDLIDSLPSIIYICEPFPPYAKV